MKIPVARDDGPAPGLAGIRTVREVARENREKFATDLALGDSISDSIRGLGQTMTQVGAALRTEQIRLATEEESIGVAEQLLGADREISDALSKDPNVRPEELPQAYLEKFGERAEALQEGLQYDGAKTYARQRAMQIANSGHAQLTAESGRRQAASGKAQLDRLAGEAVRREELGDAVGVDALLGEYDRRAATLFGVVGEDVLAAHESSLETNLSQARFSRSVAADPEGTLALLKEHPEQFPGLDLVKAKQAARAEGREQRLVSLDKQIESVAEHPERVDALLGQIDRMAAGPDADLSAESRRRARGYLLSTVKAALEDATKDGGFDIGAVKPGGAPAQPTNPKYQLAVDDYWEKTAGPAIAQLPPEVQLGETAKFAAEKGVIPRVVDERIEGDLLGFSDGAVDAARFIATVRDLGPGALRDVDRGALLHANVIGRLALAGPEQAVERAKAVLSQPKDVRELRLQQSRERFKDAPAFATEIQKRMQEPGFFGWTAGPFGTSPEIPAQLQAETRSVYDYAYAASGSHEDAMNTALQVQRGSWRVSRINGAPTMMKYAPEEVYGGGDPTSAEWMKKDLALEVAPLLTNAQRKELGLPAKGGARNAGAGRKDVGFLGELPVKGGVATEFSIGVQIDGQEVEIPTLVPTLTKEEIRTMTEDVIPNRKPVPAAITEKAVAHARKRIAAGMSPFYDSVESKLDELAARLEVVPDLLTGQSGIVDYAVTIQTDAGLETLPKRWRPDPETSPTLAAERATESSESIDRMRIMRRGGEIGAWALDIHRGEMAKAEAHLQSHIGPATPEEKAARKVKEQQTIEEWRAFSGTVEGVIEAENARSREDLRRLIGPKSSEERVAFEQEQARRLERWRKTAKWIEEDFARSRAPVQVNVRTGYDAAEAARQKERWEHALVVAEESLRAARAFDESVDPAEMRLPSEAELLRGAERGVGAIAAPVIGGLEMLTDRLQ